MPLKKVSLKPAARDQGKRLDQFLADELPAALGRPVSKAKVRKLIVAGAVYLNGARVRIASKEVRAVPRAPTIDAFIDLEKLDNDAASRDRPFEMTAERVLYEDEFLIAVDKPAGLPTQPTLDEARVNLLASVRTFLGKREGVAKPYLALHHRLDRDTSGVILLVKDARANAGVAQLFSAHRARKVYEALTALPSGAVSEHWSVKNYLARARDSGKKARFTAVRSGGDYAETDFTLLTAYPRGLHVQARPKTGRTHQIRVHLAEGGMPILGDPVYAPKSVGARASRTMLHAVSLTFPHPIHENEIAVKSPLPEDFLQCLRSLQ